LGLYLAVFQDDGSDVELEGVDIGSYEAFSAFRGTVAETLEGGVWGSQFPVLMNHDDADGSWNSDECLRLARELSLIASRLADLSPAALTDEGSHPGIARGERRSLKNSFVDGDGVPLVDRLLALAQLAASTGRSIVFQ